MWKILSFLFLLSWTIPQTGTVPSQFLWENRLIIVFAGDQKNLAEKQMTAFENEGSAVEERHLKLFEVPAGPHPWRERYSVSENEFCLLLIGKDGGVKRRASKVVTPDSLYEQIDQMPMRRREMRNQ